MNETIRKEVQLLNSEELGDLIGELQKMHQQKDVAEIQENLRELNKAQYLGRCYKGFREGQECYVKVVNAQTYNIVRYDEVTVLILYPELEYRYICTEFELAQFVFFETFSVDIFSYLVEISKDEFAQVFHRCVDDLISLKITCAERETYDPE